MLIMKKNLKRALSLLLAATMTLSMSAISAFADETETAGANESTGTTEGSTEVKWVTELPVTKCIKVTKGAAIPEETFTFTMTPATKDDITDGKYGVTTTEISSQKVQQGIDMTSASKSATISYAVSSTDTESAVLENGSTSNTGTLTLTGEKFDLASIPFSASGIYRYYITENVPSEEDRQPYIKYDTDVYIVDLYVVTKDFDTNGNATYGIKGLTITKSNGSSVYTDKPQEIVFTNQITDKLLTISKTVEGDEYTKDELFDFYIKIPVGGDTITLTENTQIYGMIYNKNGLVKDNRSIKDDDDNYTGIIKLNVKGNKADVSYDDIVKDGTHFQLKNDEELRIYAPVTMIYFVAEANYSSEGYSQTYIYTEYGSKASTTKSNTNDDEDDEAYAAIGENATPVVVKGTVNTVANAVAYTNTRNVTLPDTGINLDVVPYILLTLIAVCGGILFISRKKRVNQ
jgi:hypothetical protein